MVRWKNCVPTGWSVFLNISVFLAAISTASADLVTHWKLDEGEGEEFFDSAGGFDGFLPDGYSIEWDDGPPTQDNAVRFLNADSLIVTEFPGIGGNDPRTITFWFKTLEADAYFLGYGSNSPGRKWHIRLNGGSGVIRTEFASGQNFGALPINDGEWHHIACVFPDGAIEGSEIIHYVDGVIDPQAGGTSLPIDTAVGEGLAPWTDANSAEPYYVHFGGVLAHGFGRMLDGSMADVRIYDEELSEDQILDIMEGVDTGIDDGCPAGLRSERDGASVKLTWQPGEGETSVRVVRDGTEVAAAAPVDPPEFVDAAAPPGDLEYELTFNLANCRPLTRTFSGCPTGLEASVGREGVTLTWVNQFAYEGLEVRRGDDLLATVAGDAETYLDADAPGGFHTYSIVPTTGTCEAITADAKVLDSEYALTVIEDDPVAYWRLDEEEDVVAINSGALGAAADGLYAGLVVLENDSLLDSEPENPSILLEGIDAEVQIPDNADINTGGPWEAKTVEVWFRADVIDVERRIIYEQGGATRGLNIYVEEVDGDPLLTMSAWNRAEEAWEPIAISAEIEPEVTYHAVMVFQASENDVFGDFDGRITGYLDGEEFDTAFGADQLYAHGDDASIGGIHVNTYFPDGTNPGDGGNFVGAIDEVALYNVALDDPNGDKDLEDSRVMVHYLAGTGDGPGGGASLKPGDINGDGAFNIADMVAQLSFLFGGGGGVPECYTVPDSNPVALNQTGFAIFDYNGDGNNNIADAVAGLGGLFGGGGPHFLGEACAEIEGSCEPNCAQ